MDIRITITIFHKCILCYVTMHTHAHAHTYAHTYAHTHTALPNYSSFNASGNGITIFNKCTLCYYVHNRRMLYLCPCKLYLSKKHTHTQTPASAPDYIVSTCSGWRGEKKVVMVAIIITCHQSEGLGLHTHAHAHVHAHTHTPLFIFQCKW